MGKHNKWSANITPDHNLTIPFIRMGRRPHGLYPGFHEKQNRPRIFSISFENPNSMGTRAHQVALYVVFEAPLQMLCETPSLYKKEQETVDFITQIPTTWDETIVLHGAIGDYLAIARRNKDTWYIGAMDRLDATGIGT